MDTQVIYFSVKQPQAKLRILSQIAGEHMQSREKLKIQVPDAAVMDFVDQALWKEPQESFLPHSCGVILPFQDFIFLSLPSELPDDYLSVFNLCPTAYLSSHPVKTIYEFEDISHPQRQENFKLKFLAYQKLGYILRSS